jgi:hypothetical protein
MRVPNRGLARLSERNVESVQAEIAQEKAASLGRASNRLAEAMERLEGVPPGSDDRAEAVAAAGEALWYYVVQREACGLRDVDSVLREFRVPREVYLRMGMRRKKTDR